MSNAGLFRPNWVSLPGRTISDILEEKEIPRRVFAKAIDQSLEWVAQLISGEVSVTPKVAKLLEVTIGGSSAFWLNRQSQYDENLRRLSEEAWLQELPLKDMISFGWINAAHSDREQIRECLKFFDVADVPTWKQNYGRVVAATALRTSKTFESEPAPLFAWLRQGERIAESIDCKRWDTDSFSRSLEQVRSLTKQKDPKIFLPKLRKICAESGVAVAIVRAPAGCRASGAAMFLAGGQKALVLLSFRYLSDDQFWFSFFHEAGHLLLHNHKKVFLEGLGREWVTESEETEANQFAVDALIPKAFREALLQLPPRAKEIMRFAYDLGIAPGIVVGQLQYFKCINHGKLNFLKRRYEWT